MKCPGCSGKGKREPGAPFGVMCCQKCGGLFGECTLGESYGFVKPYMTEMPVPPEETRYYDLMCYGSQGLQRRHGWFEKATGLIVQVG